MRTTEELQTKISELEDRLCVLEGTTISAEGLTLGDIVSVSKELDSLKKELHELNQSTTVPSSSPRYFQAYAIEPESEKTVANSPSPPIPQPQPKRRFTEGNIGRYGVGILASILILLAVGTAASTFWAYIPNVAKFIALLTAGVVCEGIGWKQFRKAGVRNGFWTSLTGLGAAISFVSIVFGEGTWMLYPTIFTGIALITWFAANLFLSAKANSKVFYIITYIGGIIAASLTLTLSGGGVEREILIIAMVTLIYAIGKFGAIKTKDIFLPVLNTVFLWTVFYLLSVRINLNTQSLALYIPYLLIPFQFVIAVIILLETADSIAKEWRFSEVLTSILSCFAAFAVTLSVQSLVELCEIPATFSYETLEALLTLIVLCLCGLTAYRKNWDKYILGISPIVAFALIVLSQSAFGYEPILPALLSIALIAHPTFRKNKYVKAAAVITYLIAFSRTPIVFETAPSTISLYSGLFLLMLVPIFNYALGYVWKDGLLPGLEQLGGVIFPALAFRRMALAFNGCNMLWIAVLAGLSLAHKYLLTKQSPAKNIERDLSSFVSAGITVWICLCCYTGGIFMPSQMDKILVTVLLVIYSGIFVYKAIRNRTVWYTICSVVFPHFNLFFITGMWNNGNADILVSIFGLILSAAFVGIGFWRKQKYMRIAGLSTMMTYVFKIAVLDVAQDGDMGTRILVLLLGGIVCFGVSFAYNKLDKLYGNMGKNKIKEKENL